MTAVRTERVEHECRVQLSPTLSVFACLQLNGWAAYVINNGFGTFVGSQCHPTADTAIAAVLAEARKLASDLTIAIDAWEVRK